MKLFRTLILGFLLSSGGVASAQVFQGMKNPGTLVRYSYANQGGSGGGATNITFVQSTDVIKDSVIDEVMTFNTQPVAGNFMWVAAWDYKNAPPADLRTPMDNCGNTYVFISSVTGGTNRTKMYLWYAKNIATCSNFTITVGTATGTSANIAGMVAVAHEYSGVSQTSPIEISVCTQGNSIGPNSGGIHVTANDLIVGAMGHEGGNVSITNGPSFTGRVTYTDGNNHLPLASQDQGSGGGISAGVVNSTFTIGAPVVDWVSCGTSLLQ